MKFAVFFALARDFKHLAEMTSVDTPNIDSLSRFIG